MIDFDKKENHFMHEKITFKSDANAYCEGLNYTSN